MTWTPTSAGVGGVKKVSISKEAVNLHENIRKNCKWIPSGNRRLCYDNLVIKHIKASRTFEVNSMLIHRFRIIICFNPQLGPNLLTDNDRG